VQTLQQQQMKIKTEIESTNGRKIRILSDRRILEEKIHSEWCKSGLFFSNFVTILRLSSNWGRRWIKGDLFRFDFGNQSVGTHR
jgi:hypothetical protein